MDKALLKAKSYAKKGEIEEAKWFTKENALRNSVSLFDKEAILSLEK